MSRITQPALIDPIPATPTLGEGGSNVVARAEALIETALHRLAGVGRAPAGWMALPTDTLATAGLAAAVAASGALAGAVVWAGRRYRAAGRAVWLAITPAPVPPSEAGIALGRMLAGILRRTRRPWFGPAPRLSLEWWADPAGVRPGVWVPPDIRTELVADAIRRAWPGAAVRPTHPPVWHQPPPGHLALAPAGGPWMPLIDPTRPTPTRTPAGATGEEPLRAVLDALAERAPGEQACVQLVITTRRGPLTSLTVSGLDGGGVAGLLRAAAPAMLGSIVGSIALVVAGLLDLLTPPRATSTRRPAGHSSLGSHRPTTATAWLRTAPLSTQAAEKAIEAKRAAGPHLHTTLRIAAHTPTQRARAARPARSVRRARQPHLAATRALCAQIAGGFDLITTHAGLRGRWHHYSEPLLLRTPAASGGFFATLAELAALWHLPTDPARYRLPNPATTRRAAGPTLPRAPHTSPPPAPPPAPPSASPPPPAPQQMPRSGGSRRAEGGPAPRRTRPGRPPPRAPADRSPGLPAQPPRPGRPAHRLPHRW